MQIAADIFTGSATFTQPATGHTHRPPALAIHRGMGGFPMPHEMVSSAVHKFFPNLERRIKRTVTIPAARTLTSQQVEGGQQAPGSRPVVYITFDALVGRNSTFHDLTREQIEELCGVEFKALNCLVWIVPCVRLHPLPCSPLTLTTSCALVLLDPPGHLIRYHCTIYVSSEVETRLHPSQPAFQSFTSVVRALQELEEPQLNPFQVFVVPGHFRIYEFGDVVGGPIYVTLPTSLPYGYHSDIFDHSWKHGICEFSYLGSHHVILTYFSQPIL